LSAEGEVRGQPNGPPDRAEPLA